eukprot:CAMPEP_0115287630 /NCGR_PEP_ID=MMETSP0270-20121206/62558_1 /TAXON_ID=71861 /ORGANISM="Scrippsiella trochoidea, Strain CCMP3099" /LENGTH=74 /DNA_ID=CAMNT_0002704715 /DNA_START=68 /DNA_END=289 /DNA_ORIENTATION=+
MGGTGGLGCMMGGAIVSAVSLTHGAYALPRTAMGGADVNAVPVSLTDLACTAAGRGSAQDTVPDTRGAELCRRE